MPREHTATNGQTTKNTSAIREMIGVRVSDYADTRPQTWMGSAIKSPVASWSLLGAIFVGLQGYLYARWLLSGPSPAPQGATPIPLWMNVAVWTHIAAGIPVAAAMAY